jgi:hypothetical protein
MTSPDLELEKKNSKFVIYENYLLNVEKYIIVHPGGRNMIEENLFSDVGRYLTGTQAYSTKIKAHSHKLATFEYALKNLAYAEIKESDHIVIKDNMDHFINDTFSIMGKREIAQSIFEYRVSSINLTFVRFQTGHTWIGKHFSFTSKKLNKTRYYTLCLAMDEDVKNCHNSLLNNVMKDNAIKPIVNMTSNYLAIFSKRYNFQNTLSNELYISMEDFIIRGPMGIGLNLDPKLSGTHIIFAAGTGILPFIDLIALTIRYTCFKAKGKTIFNETFDNIAPDFKLVVFASYTNEACAIYHEECEKLVSIDKEYNLNVFSYHVRISSKDNTKWDTQFMNSNLKGYDNMKKIMIVGPVGFMEVVKDALNTSIHDVSNLISLP